MLRNGSTAPTFELPSHTGDTFALEQTKGRITCLLFLRGRFCPTTRRFLVAYEDFMPRLRELNVSLVGISCDSVDDNRYLVEHFSLRFPLLSDADFAVCEKFGAYRDEHKGKVFPEPALVIIDVDGKVAYSVISSGPKGLPSPGDIAPVLLYMHSHKGRY